MEYAIDDQVSVWIMTLPAASGSGRYVHAVFASDTLAEEWAAENSWACRGAEWQPYRVHVPAPDQPRADGTPAGDTASLSNRQTDA